MTSPLLRGLPVSQIEIELADVTVAFIVACPVAFSKP